MTPDWRCEICRKDFWTTEFPVGWYHKKPAHAKCLETVGLWSEVWGLGVIRPRWQRRLWEAKRRRPHAFSA